MRRSPLLTPLLGGLLSPQCQQLCVSREDLRNRVLELPALLHQRTDLLHPIVGNAFDALLAIDHERQRPNRMSFSIGASAVVFSAAPVSQRERAGQSVCRNLETTEQRVLALTQASGRISFGVIPFHLHVLLHTDLSTSSILHGWGNLRLAASARWQVRLSG